MNAAICCRVTNSSGQNSVFDGGLHPSVTRASASQSMSDLKMLSSATSVKPDAAMAIVGTATNSAIAVSTIRPRVIRGILAMCSPVKRTLTMTLEALDVAWRARRMFSVQDYIVAMTPRPKSN
jgi:hypothetical protein